MTHKSALFCIPALLVWAALELLSPSAACAQVQADPLLRGFQAPPNSAKPRVWWHWMDGNVTKDGIRLDLEWMKRVGVGGMDTIDASMATPQVVKNRLIYMSDDWKDAFRYAADLADQFGLEMSINTSPGWSETGGPWVKPSQAMKKLAHCETERTLAENNPLSEWA